jgi:hypothetical protein
MLKAEQNKLAHEASVSLVDIRNIELQYYMTFFNTIAVQFTFIAGYQLTTYYNTEALSYTAFEPDVQEAFQVCYWFFTIISVFLSLEGMLVSVYTVMFGQALALRGPAGSMIRAINGFEKEQKHVLVVFSMTLFFLGIATIFQFFVVMDWVGSILCSIVAVVGMYHWYRHCMDIYNRYKYKKESADWKKRDDHRDSDYEEGVVRGHDYDNNPLEKAERQRELLQRQASTGGFITIIGDGSADGESHGKKSSSLFEGVFGKKTKSEWPAPTGSAAGVDMTSIAASTGTGTGNPLHGAPTAYSDANFQGLLFDGEVEVRSSRGATRERADRDGSSSWTSRYVLLTENKFLMFFDSLKEYRVSSTASRCRVHRPLDLSRYSYRVIDGGASGRDVVLLTLASALMSQEPPKSDKDLENDGARTVELRCRVKADTDRMVRAIAVFAKPGVVQTV